MKKIFIALLFLIPVLALSQIKDTAALRLRINADIVPNNNASITATKLNNILNGNINGFANLFKSKVDSVWSSGSTLYVKINGNTYTYSIVSGTGLDTLTGDARWVKIQRFIDSISALNSRINNFFNGTTAISGYNYANWNTAYSWGNHATAGYSLYSDSSLRYAMKRSDNTFTGLNYFYNRTGFFNVLASYNIAQFYNNGIAILTNNSTPVGAVIKANPNSINGDATYYIPSKNQDDTLALKSDILSNSSTWGGITGTLSNQTDLRSALDSNIKVYNNGLFTGTYFTNKKLLAYGASVEVGANASPYSAGWLYKLASSMKATLIDSAIGGTAFQPYNANSFISRLHNIPAYDTSFQYVFIGASNILNDCDLGFTRSTISTYFNQAIDTLTAKGWPIAKIYLVTPNPIGLNSFSRNEDSLKLYVDSYKSAATARGVGIVDNFYYMKTLPNYKSYIDSDSIHLNQQGHYVNAEYASAQLGYGIYSWGHLHVDGTTFLKDTVTINYMSLNAPRNNYYTSPIGGNLSFGVNSGNYGLILFNNPSYTARSGLTYNNTNGHSYLFARDLLIGTQNDDSSMTTSNAAIYIDNTNKSIFNYQGKFLGGIYNSALGTGIVGSTSGVLNNISGTGFIKMSSTTPSYISLLGTGDIDSTSNGFMTWLLGKKKIDSLGAVKQGNITLTTTGTSGAATLAGNTLNIPQYAGTNYSAGRLLGLSGTTFYVDTTINVTWKGTFEHDSTVTIKQTTPKFNLTTQDGNSARFTRSTTSNQFQISNQTISSGGIGNAINFNGTSQYFTASDAGFPTGTSIVLSISMWVKIPPSKTTWYPVFRYGSGSSSLEAYFDINNNFTVRQNTTNLLNFGNMGAINDNSWHHLVFVINGSSVTVYKDGTSLATGSGLSIPNAVATSGTFQLVSSFGGYPSGGLDQYLVYTRALSSTDVTNIYNLSSGTATPSTTNLIRKYDFDEGTTNATIIDATGNANATPQASPTYLANGNGITPTAGSAVTVYPLNVTDATTNGEYSVTQLSDANSRTVLQGKWFQVSQGINYPVVSDNAGRWQFNPSNTSNTIVPTLTYTINSTGGVSTDSLKTSAIRVGYVSKATSYSIGATDNIIEVTATGQTMTLPTALGISGKTYTIKLTASGSSTIATTSSQTIDGSTTYSLSAQYKYVTVVSNGAGWLIIANN